MVYLRYCMFLTAFTSHQSDDVTHQAKVTRSSLQRPYNLNIKSISRRTNASEIGDLD